MQQVKKNYKEQMKASFHTQPRPVTLSSATLQNTEELKLNKHIIVCGSFQGLQHLLMPLRARSLLTILPIIIILNDPMPSEIWESIKSFP